MNQLRVLARKLLIAIAFVMPCATLGGVAVDEALGHNHFSFSFGGFAPAPCYHPPVYAYPAPYYPPPVRVYYPPYPVYPPYYYGGCHWPHCW